MKLISIRALTITAALSAALSSAAFADALEGKMPSSEILASSAPSDWRTLPQKSLLYIALERGVVVVALSEQLAQSHVTQIKTLAKEGFYDGLSFYRVIDGFVAQGGDVFEKREVKDAKKTLKAEFDQPLIDGVDFDPMQDEDGYAAKAGFVQTLPAGVDEEGQSIWHLHCAGAMAMARGSEKDTAGTEFYIALQPQRYLDRNLTVLGRVVQGMEYLQALRRVQPAQYEDDDLGETILSMRIGEELPVEERVALEILRSGTETFQHYVASRRNRPEAFFHYRPDHIDVCDLPIPVREQSAEDGE